jgi:hypothetical protein
MSLPDGIGQWSHIYCDSCGTKLEILNLSPLELETVYDDEDDDILYELDDDDLDWDDDDDFDEDDLDDDEEDVDDEDEDIDDEEW